MTPPGNFGRPLIGDQRRHRYNVVLDPALQEDVKGAADLVGDSFSMWMEEAARDRLKVEKTDLSTLTLHGVGEIHMPRIGYNGGMSFHFRCGQRPLLLLDDPSSSDLGAEMGSATGMLHLGNQSCRIECTDLSSVASINRRLELHPSPWAEVILTFGEVAPSDSFAIFLSNVRVDLPSSARVGETAITLERVHHSLREARVARRSEHPSMVTAMCALTFKRPPRDFVANWAKPISKFLQVYAGGHVDIVAWGRLNKARELVELHLPADVVQPSSNSPCLARREDGPVDWEPFLQKGIPNYLRHYEGLKLGAFSQYLAMANAPCMTVNGKSALLLPATELIANTIGSRHGLIFPEGRNLNSKVKAILHATGLSMSKAKRQALDQIVRDHLRNPLFHEGLPSPSIGTLDNAKVNAFLKGLAISLHSTLIGIDASHCFTRWDTQCFMTPAEWLADGHTV